MARRLQERLRVPSDPRIQRLYRWGWAPLVGGTLTVILRLMAHELRNPLGELEVAS